MIGLLAELRDRFELAILIILVAAMVVSVAIAADIVEVIMVLWRAIAHRGK